MFRYDLADPTPLPDLHRIATARRLREQRARTGHLAGSQPLRSLNPICAEEEEPPPSFLPHPSRIAAFSPRVLKSLERGRQVEKGAFQLHPPIPRLNLPTTTP